MIKYWLPAFFLITALMVGTENTYAALLDPTKPVDFSAREGNGFVLSAIVIASDHRLAVINGKIVHVGDEVNGAKVTAINKDTVAIDGPDGKHSLVLIDLFSTGPVKIAK